MTVLHKPDPVSSLLGSACQRVDVEWKRVRGMAGIQMKNKEAVAENSGRQGRKRQKGWRPDRGRLEDGNNVKERYTVWKSGYPNTQCTEAQGCRAKQPLSSHQPGHSSSFLSVNYHTWTGGTLELLPAGNDLLEPGRILTFQGEVNVFGSVLFTIKRTSEAKELQ